MKNKAPYYNSKSDFDLKNNKTPLYSFGESRDKFAKVYLESSKAIDMDVPGPGKYNYSQMFAKEAPKFSIIGKGKYPENSWAQYPAPNRYDLKLSINKDGKYYASNFRNATSIIFGASLSKRTPLIASSVPGPGSYKEENLITGNTQRINFNSKFKSPLPKTINGKPKDISSQAKCCFLK